MRHCFEGGERQIARLQFGSEGVGGSLLAGNLPNGFSFIGFLIGNPANGFSFIGFLIGNPANGFPFIGLRTGNPANGFPFIGLHAGNRPPRGCWADFPAEISP